MGTRHKIVVEETYIREFYVGANEECEAMDYAFRMWRDSESELPDAKFARAAMSVNDGEFMDIAEGFKPGEFTEVYTVEWTGENVAEFSDFKEALNSYMSMNVGNDGWKYLSVDYVDKNGSYHPEMALGLLYEGKEREA